MKDNKLEKSNSDYNNQMILNCQHLPVIFNIICWVHIPAVFSKVKSLWMAVFGVIGAGMDVENVAKCSTT